MRRMDSKRTKMVGGAPLREMIGRSDPVVDPAHMDPAGANYEGIRRSADKFGLFAREFPNGFADASNVFSTYFG